MYPHIKSIKLAALLLSLFLDYLCMLLHALKKHFLMISIGLLVNILIFIFWWVVTDPGNYIWETVSESNSVLLYSACNKLFLIRYYISVVIINSTLIALYIFNTNRLLSIGIVLFIIGFYFLTKFLFDPFIGRNYFIIFENQNVSKMFMLEPISDAGVTIAPYLVEKLNEQSSYSREQAAKGLGIIEYTPSINKLNVILTDTCETTNMRAECYYSLKKINTPKTKILLENFSHRSVLEMKDTALVERINYLERQDIY